VRVGGLIMIYVVRAMKEMAKTSGEQGTGKELGKVA
jgi:hypothetical protein